MIEAARRERGFDDVLRAAVLAALRGRPTPEQSLLVVQAVHPERVVVLARAFGSARVAERFKHPRKVFELLMLLAGPYWEALSGGKGDAQARGVFGKDTFCATESATTKGNSRAAELRTVMYGGRARVLWAHLKIGTKLDSHAETLRIHFEWIAAERRILIGHCGEHLDLR